jgi:hypothetical protein
MGRVLVGFVAVLAVTAGAYGDLVTGSASFGAGTNATAYFNVSGSSSVSGSGTWYSWVGWPTNNWQSGPISFNNQSPGFSGAPQLGSNPTGSKTIAMDPTDGPDIDAFTRLEHASLNALSANIKDGAAYNLGNYDGVTLTGTGGGHTVTLTLNATPLSMSALSFNMTGGPTGVLTNYSSNPPAGQMVQATYSIAPYGTLAATLGTTALTGTMYFDGSPVGINLAMGGGSASVGETMINGVMVLTELAGPYPRSVADNIRGDLATPVSVAFGTSGSYYYNNYSGGTNPYYIVSLSYSQSGTVSATAHLDIYDTILNIIPEPVTLAVLGLGGALLTLSRRRSR